MAESQRMVSGKLGGKNRLYSDPTLRRTVWEIWEGILGILSVELDGFLARKWNLERVIVFQSVILQRAQSVNNPAQIFKGILF